MDLQAQHAKMVAVDADLFESVGYEDLSHCLFIKFRNSPMLKYEKVPRFRFQGLLGAPRKDPTIRPLFKTSFSRNRCSFKNARHQRVPARRRTAPQATAA